MLKKSTKHNQMLLTNSKSSSRKSEVFSDKKREKIIRTESFHKKKQELKNYILIEKDKENQIP